MQHTPDPRSAPPISPRGTTGRRYPGARARTVPGSLAASVPLALLSLAALLAAPPLAAQDSPAPNPLCLAAESIGAMALPYAREGTLLDDPQDERLEFLRFEAAPGAELDVNLRGEQGGFGTLGDPLLGLFDADCAQIAVNDDFRSLNSFLRVTVPEDGVFVLGVTRFSDFGFDGSITGRAGTYELSITEAPPTIDSISVRVVNALGGEPLPGDREPFAFVELYRCDADCNERIGAFNANGEGRVEFRAEWFFPPLTAGTYLLRVSARTFGSNESGRFTVGPGEAFEVWDVALEPPPISIGEVVPCLALPPQGGACRYEVTVNNNTREALRGLLWSRVDAFGIGSPAGSSSFEASAGTPRTDTAIRAPLAIEALSSQSVAFAYEVPSFVEPGAEFCSSLAVGLEPGALLNTLVERALFCIQKRPNTAFKVLSGVSTSKTMAQGQQQALIERRLQHGAERAPDRAP